MNIRLRAARILLLIGSAILTTAPESAGQTKGKKTVAGVADMLRKLPKKFGSFLGYDAKAGSVTLQFEGEKKPTTWKLRPAAEIKIHGWWGRPQQLTRGDRLYAWFAIDRNKKPTGIVMLADEPSEQLIHGWRYTVSKINDASGLASLKAIHGKSRELTLPKGVAANIAKYNALFFQTADGKPRFVWTETELEKALAKQKEFLREIWRKDGLPGTVVFVHPLSGEMDVMLDHEAMRWARYLKNGDKVELTADGKSGKPIKTTVKLVEPWREFTRLRLVNVTGLDQVDLNIGQRIAAHVPEPPTEVQQSLYPTDIGRLKEKKARVEWFVSNTYCTCKVRGDRCTGMYYTLACCNENACGMPNNMRRQIGGMIDKGMTDRQIMDDLLKKRGADLLRPHLLP